jgi:hypothetical protein
LCTSFRKLSVSLCVFVHRFTVAFQQQDATQT